MKDIFRLGAILFVICAVASLMLSLTNNITAPVIEQRNIQANNESRQEVLQVAEEFSEVKDVRVI